MSSIVRTLVIGAAGMCTAVIGGFAVWTHQQARGLPEGQKGNLLDRMQSVTHAMQQVNQIQDKHTHAHHVRFVASLSSRASTLASEKAEEELLGLRTSYYAGYIANALQKSDGLWPPLFRYDVNGQVALPTLPGQTHEGFVFAGAAGQIHDRISWYDIQNGWYLRCRNAMEVFDKKDPNHFTQYKKVDVVLTGTRDQTKCSLFEKALLGDLAYIAASDGKDFDPERPYSDTRVITFENGTSENTGDLTDIPPEAKRMIRRLIFTACPNYSLQKTRLSHGSYKQVGAIVVGTTNKESCDAFHFRHMREVLNQLQSKP